MKKMTRNMILTSLLVLSLAVAGCGEEEKYNKAKNALIPQIEKTWNLNYDKKDEAEAAWKKIDAQVKDMEKLAQSETKLNNDLLKIKKEIEIKKQKQQDSFKEAEALKKMHEEAAKAPRLGMFGLPQ